MRNDLDRARQSSVKGGLQLSQQEMHAPMATLSLDLPLSLLVDGRRSRSGCAVG